MVLTVFAPAGFSNILFRLSSGMSNLSILLAACRSSLRAGSSDASTCDPEGLRETKPEVADTALATSSPFPDWISIVAQKLNPPQSFPFRLLLGGGSLLCEVSQDGVRKRGERQREMEMLELLGFLSVWEVLWAVQAEAGGKRRRKGKVHRGKVFFSSLHCPVITHTYTEAYVNSHVGSERQIEIWAVRAGPRMTTKESRKIDLAARETRRTDSFTVSLWTTLKLILVVYSNSYAIIFSNSMISAF